MSRWAGWGSRPRAASGNRPEEPRANPLWRKAPLALARDRTLFGAVACAAALLALAAASSPLFAKAVGNAALVSRLSELTPMGAGLVVSSSTITSPGDSVPPADVVAGAVTAVYGVKLVRDPIATDLTAAVGTEVPGRVPEETPPDVRLTARTGALSHVRKLSGGGEGAWIADTVAKTWGLRPGDDLVLVGKSSARRTHVRVAGIYEALWKEPERTPYWVNLAADIYPRNPGDQPPPTLAFVPGDEIRALYNRTGGGAIERIGEFPLATSSLTLEQARLVEEHFHEAEVSCGEALQGFSACESSDGLGNAVRGAETTIAAVTPIGSLLAAAGALVALAVVAAAGAYLVARRRAEAQLLFARGERASAFAARSALEALLPALVGTLVGLVLAVGIVRLLGSHGAIDGAGLRAAAVAAATRLPLGLALLAIVAGVAFLSQFEIGRPRGTGLRLVPWELVLAGLAVWIYLDLRSGGGIVGGAHGGVAHPSISVFLFPVLCVAAAAVFLARVLRLGLRVHGRRGAGLSTPLYLAVRRLAAGRGLATLLVAAAAVSLGAFLYAQALVATLDRSADVKAHVAVGSDFQALINHEDRLPQGTSVSLTKVDLEYAGASLEDGRQFDLMAIDGRTFGRAAFWDPKWGSLARILAALARPAQPGVVPVVVAGATLPSETLDTLAGPLPVRAVASVPAFPGMSADRPLVVTTEQALERASDRSGRSNPMQQGSERTYVWGKGSPDDVEGAVRASGVTPYYIVTVDSVLGEPDIAAEIRSFGFLRALGIGVGLLAILGLLFYLQARQRGRILASALSRRMGLRGEKEALAVGAELAAVLLVAFATGAVVSLAAARIVLPHVDPLATLAPAPLFRTPLEAVLVAGICVLVVASIGGALVQWAARRANVANVMRLGE
ncbi:MAG TPA: hypothetical protein VH306_01270 [Gaiellaceae bacterium]